MRAPVVFANRSARVGSFSLVTCCAARSESSEARPLPFATTSWVVNTARTSSSAAFGVQKLIPGQHDHLLQQDHFETKHAPIQIGDPGFGGSKPWSPGGRASSRAPSGRPTGPPRSRPTSTTRAPATSRFDELAAAYREAARGLLEGGADLLLVETIFDTLNAKAAIFAIESSSRSSASGCPDHQRARSPTPRGRTLSGQTVEAFWNRVRHARPLTVGLNCALGRRRSVRQYLQELARVADMPVCATRTPACRTSSAATTRRPPETSASSATSPRTGLVNLVGGCCGTTPAHIRAIAEAVRGLAAAGRPGDPDTRTRLAGLEPLIDPPAGQPLRQRRRADERHRLARVRPGHPRRPTTTSAVEIARSRSRTAPRLIDVNMDEAMLDSAAAMTRFLDLVAIGAGHREGPGDDRLVEVVASSRQACKCVQGRPIVNSI